MCVASMIVDHFGNKWGQISTPQPSMPLYPLYPPVPPVPMITPAEVEEFRRLLERAREYDRKNGEPDCDMESKKQKVMELAKALGVEIDFL